jgi:UTP--glucose-1-phosphate uridylyltransferase
VSINGIVEKPQNHIAPSNLAIIGRYILTPTVMKNLHERKSNVDGEVQLTDAIVGTLEDSENVYGFRFEGQRFDCGSKAGYLRTCIAFSLSSNELRDDFYNFLRELVYSSKAAE